MIYKKLTPDDVSSTDLMISHGLVCLRDTIRGTQYR